MAAELINTGISIIGEVPWGTHFCHFYETKQDLLDTLIPYFKAGLESNEFCLWVVSTPTLITVEEAKRALAQAVPDLDRHLSEQTIEILDGYDLYFEKNALNLERARSAWDAKLKLALARGYDGMRVSGDTFWLAEKDWADFFAYEKQLNDSITDQPMTVLCTYPLGKSGAAEVLDVVQAHQFAIARRQGEWEVIESPELIEAKAEIKRLNAELEQRVVERTGQLAKAIEELTDEISDRKQAEVELSLAHQRLSYHVENTPLAVIEWDKDLFIKRWSKRAEEVFGWQASEALGINLYDPDFRFVYEEDAEAVAEIAGQLMKGTVNRNPSLNRNYTKDGNVIYCEWYNSILRDEDGNVITILSLVHDVTERKQAEEKLHAKEQEFRAIVENAPDQIIRYDREFRRVYVNPAVAKVYGLPAESLTGKPIGSVIQDAGLDVSAGELRQLRQRIASVFDTGKSCEFEITWPMPTGRKYYSSRLFPELDLNGSVINVLGIARDITERKQAEDALRRSKDRLRLVVDTIPLIAWSLQPDGTVDFLNQRWVDYSGLSLEQFVAEPTRAIHPEDVSRVMEKWRTNTDAREPYVDEMRLRRADGEYRWFLVRTAPLRDEEGNVVKWYGVSIEIEDRKQAEAKLKQSESQLAEAQHVAHVGSWNWDLQRNVLTCSDELNRIFGVDPQVFTPTYEDFVEGFIHAEDRARVRDVIESSLKTQQPFSFYNRILRTDGEERVIYARGNVVSDEHGNPIRMVGTAQDVTERKRAEETLKATSEQLRALSARIQSAKEEEGARIARELHDELGSTLTGMKWSLDEIEGQLSSAEKVTDVHKLRQKIGLLSDLIASTLNTIRRISSELRPSILDDVGLAAAIRWQAQQFEERTGIACNFSSSVEVIDLSGEQSTAVFRISQEALTNIVRHAQATGVEIAIKVEAGQFVLTISDNGKGIKANEKVSAEAFGLLGMRERAHLVGGEVTINGSEGRGTVVTVRIPVGHPTVRRMTR